jgi:hypothetical protein
VVKLEIKEDAIPLLVRALEHDAVYLEATKRPDDRCLALAQGLQKSSRRRRLQCRSSTLSAGRDEIRSNLALARKPAPVGGEQHCDSRSECHTTV